MKSLIVVVFLFVIQPKFEATAQVFDLGPSDPALFNNVIDVPPSPNIGSHATLGGDGQTTQLNLLDGGRVDNRFTANAGVEINVIGGRLGALVEANSGSEFNISGGQVAFRFDANSGSVLNITGGAINTEFDAYTGSVLNIDGGTFGNIGSSASHAIKAFSGSVINIRGGSFFDLFIASGGSDVNISGGVFSHISAESGAVELSGGEFRLNGVAVIGNNISVDGDDVFTGTLADGTPFVFGQDDGSDQLTDAELTTLELPPLDTTPMIVNGSEPYELTGLRVGQTLSVQPGGELREYFSMVDATLHIEGGNVGPYAKAAGSWIEMSSGTIGNASSIHAGSVLNVSGGNVGWSFGAYDSTMNITGGNVLSSFDAYSSLVNISGTPVLDDINAYDGTEVNIFAGAVSSVVSYDNSTVSISGGYVAAVSAVSGLITIEGGEVGTIDVRPDGEVRLFGTDFLLDGVPLVLLPGESIVMDEALIGDRNLFSLVGQLADGSPFDFDFTANPSSFPADCFLFDGSPLVLTLVPEPGGLVLLLLGVFGAERRFR